MTKQMAQIMSETLNTLGWFTDVNKAPDGKYEIQVWSTVQDRPYHIVDVIPGKVQYLQYIAMAAEKAGY